jgi:hypothetical protein
MAKEYRANKAGRALIKTFLIENLKRDNPKMNDVCILDVFAYADAIVKNIAEYNSPFVEVSGVRTKSGHTERLTLDLNEHFDILGEVAEDDLRSEYEDSGFYWSTEIPFDKIMDLLSDDNAIQMIKRMIKFVEGDKQ